MKEKTVNKVAFIIFFVLLFIDSMLILQFYILPAYHSLKADCYPNAITDTSIQLLGSFSVDTNTQEYEITTIPNAPAWVTAHELCHLRQYKEGRLSSCEESKLGVFVNELEAYAGFPC